MKIGEERGRKQPDKNQEEVARGVEIVQLANQGIVRRKHRKAKQEIEPRWE
jgi:hypothetical protein